MLGRRAWKIGVALAAFALGAAAADGADRGLPEASPPLIELAIFDQLTDDVSIVGVRDGGEARVHDGKSGWAHAIRARIDGDRVELALVVLAVVPGQSVRHGVPVFEAARVRAAFGERVALGDTGIEVAARPSFRVPDLFERGPQRGQSHESGLFTPEARVGSGSCASSRAAPIGPIAVGKSNEYCCVQCGDNPEQCATFVVTVCGSCCSEC